MDLEKRKRVGDGESDHDSKRGKVTEKDDNVMVAPADEEVDEFFAILRRIQVAVKYFQKQRDGGSELITGATPWNPSFEPCDFDDGVKETQPEKSEGDQKTGLDLNLDPGSDDRRSGY